MKKYLRLSCSVCQRIIDTAVDDKRFTPDKCNITLHCEGRLSPVEYRSSSNVSLIPEVGVTDWRPRSSVLNPSATSEVILLDTSCGSYQQLVLAVNAPNGSPGTSASLELVLNERDESPKASKQYVFRFDTSFSTVSGIESGLDKKTLRFSSTDVVQVFLNGVKIEQGSLSTNFTVYNGLASSAVPPNTIGFNTPVSLPGINQVDVIVSQVSAGTQKTISFTRNVSDESRLGTGSWENIDYVQIHTGYDWANFYLFTFDIKSSAVLKLNSVLTVDSMRLNGVPLELPRGTLLLSRKPYSTLDRYTNLGVYLSKLTSANNFLKYHSKDSIPVLELTSTTPEPIYPLMRVSKFNVEKTVKTSLPGVSNQILIDGSVIVGPDI
jgi:hypothetical protein